MSFTIETPQLKSSNKSALALPVAVGATSITLFSTDGMKVNDWYVIDTPTTSKSEPVQIVDVVSATVLTTTATLYSHTVGNPFTFTQYTQIQINKATAQSGPYSLYDTIPIEFNQRNTEYIDPTGIDSDWYNYNLYNPTTLKQGTPSVNLSPGTGYDFVSFYSLKKRVADLLKDQYNIFISSSESGNYINEKNLAMQNTLITQNKHWGLAQVPVVIPTDGITQEFAMPSNVYKVSFVLFSQDGTQYYPADSGEMTQVLRLANQPFINWNFTTVNMFGYPQISWYLNGPNIGMFPYVKGFFKIYFYAMPALLVNDTDVLVSPLNVFSQMIVNYGVRRGYQKSSKSDLERVIELKKIEDEDDLIFKSALKERQTQKPPHIRTTDTRWMEPFMDDTFGLTS